MIKVKIKKALCESNITDKEVEDISINQQKIIDQYMSNEWSEPLTADQLLNSLQLESEQKKENVVFLTCNLFEETYAEKSKGNVSAVKAFNDFIRSKQHNPIQPFGSKDVHFKTKGIFKGHIPNLKHCHLQHDLMICYSIEGQKPHIIKLYGIFKHDDLGIGEPPNIKRQKSVAKSLVVQKFNKK